MASGRRVIGNANHTIVVSGAASGIALAKQPYRILVGIRATRDTVGTPAAGGFAENSLLKVSGNGGFAAHPAGAGEHPTEAVANSALSSHTNGVLVSVATVGV